MVILPDFVTAQHSNYAVCLPVDIFLKYLFTLGGKIRIIAHVAPLIFRHQSRRIGYFFWFKQNGSDHAVLGYQCNGQFIQTDTSVTGRIC